ncbi:MAG TPA: phosphomannomutase/phosphoglucomutase [Candidatus Binatia bacterium]|nr:phosphomannomutase/phosphoglucomutase [Candidatus Binatia bacterium]
MQINESIFKAYDIRGIYPEQINKDTVYRIAQAYAKFLNPKNVVLGRDVRLSGDELWEAAKNGLVDHGVNVIDIGVISTDTLYFAVANYMYDGGITISASHNPAEYNGMKMVSAQAVPISGDTGIQDIKRMVLEGYEYKAAEKGKVTVRNVTQEYLEKCLSFINKDEIKHFSVVANAMFGPALQNVMQMNLPITLKMLNESVDGSFPKGQPDPMQETNRQETVAMIEQEKPDFGVAWDGDADRFFMFDENGRFIPGYYLTAFLGKYFVSRRPGSKVICDPRLTWAIMDDVSSAGGVPIINKSGHSFFKDRMRKEDAIFAGESSGHFYFRDYFFADNGLIPFLLILHIMSSEGKKLSELFDRYFELYPISGEINLQLQDQSVVKSILDKFERNYQDAAKTEKVDGLSVEYPDWRANVRGSNTEPLLRVNVEAKNQKLLKEKTDEVLKLIDDWGKLHW